MVLVEEMFPFVQWSTVGLASEKPHPSSACVGQTDQAADATPVDGREHHCCHFLFLRGSRGDENRPGLGVQR